MAPVLKDNSAIHRRDWRRTWKFEFRTESLQKCEPAVCSRQVVTILFSS